MNSGFMFTDDNEYIRATLDYVYKPLEGAKIRQFARPIDFFRRNRIDTSRTADSLLSEDENAAYRFVERVSRWIPANPSKPEVVARHEAAYHIMTAEPASHSGLATLWANVGDKQGSTHIRFGLDSAIRDHDLIALIGQRGSGKTAFMNYWLSNRSVALEKENITWFRTDVNKIFELWRDTKRSVHDLLELYNRVHSIYVILVYGDFLRGELKARLSEGVATTGFLSRITLELREDCFLNDVNIISGYFETFLHKARHKIAIYDEDISRSLVSHTIKDRNNAVMKSIDRLYSALLEDLRRRSITVLFIVDGLDNISWTKGSDFYVDSCKRIVPFYKSLRTRLPGLVKMIVAVRPETIDEIEQYNFIDAGFNKNPELPSEEHGVNFHKCWVAVPQAKEVILCKLRAASQTAFNSDLKRLTAALKNSSLSEKRISLAVQKLINDMDLYFTAIGREFRNAFERDVKKSYNHKSQTQRAMLARIDSAIANEEDLYARLLFDFDVRALLDNLYKVLRVRDISGKMHVPLFDQPERLIQYLFLNGRAYMDTMFQINNPARARKDFTERGSVFPNIFWYDAREFHSADSAWHGLCGLRILQSIRFNSDILVGDLVILLNECFHYPIALIIECVEAFVAFGLIEVNISDRPWARRFRLQCAEDNQLTREYKAYLKVTEKSILYLEYIWTRPDIMYYFALDAPIGVGFVEDSRLIQISRDFDDLRSIDDFYVAAVPTVAVFFRHIVAAATSESSLLDRRFTRSKCNLSNIVNLNLYKEFLASPPQWRINFERFVRYGIESRKASSHERSNKIRSNIEGVINYV